MNENANPDEFTRVMNEDKSLPLTRWEEELLDTQNVENIDSDEALAEGIERAVEEGSMYSALKAELSGEEYLSVEQRFQMNLAAQREDRQVRAQAIQLAIQASASGLVPAVITYLDAAEGILDFLLSGDESVD